MKRLIASAGLAALGLVGFQAASETSKPWTVSASLRGFYDDNITTLPDVIVLGMDAVGNPLEVHRQESFGLSLDSRVSYGFNRAQTELGLSYAFGLRWYEERSPEAVDHSHTLSAQLKHAASPDLSLELTETFRIAQEPEVVTGSLLRARGDQDYLHNQFAVHATKSFPGTLSVHVGYANTLFEFDDRSFSSLLDRVEHTPLIHLKKLVNPDTEALIGYRFKAVDYTADAWVGNDMKSDIRDSDSHYVYGGFDRALNERTQFSARLGLQQTEFVNVGDSATSPFADFNLSHGYAEGSRFQLGVKHERNRNDLAHRYTPGSPEDQGTENLILDQEQTMFYLSIDHRVTEKIFAQLVGHYVDGDYEGGGPEVDGTGDEYYAIGLGLRYVINEHLAAELGFNFDDYSSGILSELRSYDRSRVYFGIQASY